MQQKDPLTLTDIVGYTFGRLKHLDDLDTSGDMLFSGHARYLAASVLVHFYNCLLF